MQSRLSFQLLLAVAGLTATVVANPTNVRAACPESYAPCSCESTANGLEVTCNNVDVATIKNVFFNTAARALYSVSLTATDPGSVSLPKDLLNDKTVQRITLACPVNVVPRLTLSIDPDAFLYTRRYTTYFGIRDCDLSPQTDMSFLDEFSALSELRIERSLNIGAFSTLPASQLVALKTLAITNSTGLVAFPDFTPVFLERVALDGNELTDATAASILVALAASSSVSSLLELSLANNALSKIPRVTSFSRLVSFDISRGGQIPFITQSNLLFTDQMTFVGLKDLSITFIEGGAFNGDFRRAEINLENNQLTEFSSDAFKNVLDQMATRPVFIAGKLVVTGNPFDCGCSLAWLIRDNRNLLPYIVNGVCGGFFNFADLNPESYADCPAP